MGNSVSKTLPRRVPDCKNPGRGLRRLRYTHTAVIRSLLLLALVSTISACASTGALGVAREQFKSGSTESALQILADASVSQRNQLLLHLDRGLIYQAAERFAESTREFEAALDVIDSLDYFSTKDQAASLVSSDWAIRYSGESSERLWIHTFQMINYLMLNQPQGAAVEARRAVALFEEHADVLSPDIFTRYLMALSFHIAGQRDSAQVEFRKLADDFSLQTPDPLKKDEGELIVFVASGFIQPKLPGNLYIDVNARIAFPYYPQSYQVKPDIRVTLAGEPVVFDRFDTALLPVARSALEQRGKAITARQALRLAAKYQIAERIGEKDELAGGIAQIIMLLTEQADTRSWETLPASLSLLRMTLPLENQSVTVTIDSTSDVNGGINLIEIPVELNKTRREFHIIRAGVAPG